MYYLQGQTAQFTKHKTKLMVALYNSYVQGSRLSQSTLANLAFTLQNIRQKRPTLPERIYNSITAKGADNVYLLVSSSWKVNIAENPIAVMGL